MGIFRVLQFPVEDSYFGSYLCRIPVIPDDYKGEIQTIIADGQTGSLEELLSNLSYYGIDSSFIDLFTDLKYNNIPLGTPPGYEAAFLLHQVYPNLSAINERSAIVLSNSAKVYDSSVTLYNKVTIANDGADYSTTFYAHNGNGSAYLLEHSITLNQRSTDFYGFSILVHGVFASDLNGNKFNFSEDSTAPVLQISINQSNVDVGQVTEHTWGYQAVVFDLDRPIGLNLKNAMDGQETDDAEQDSDDPYDDGGDSGGGGGGGSFDDDSDVVDFPDLPDISAADTGFISLYVPSATQIKDLANYMWNNNLFDIDSFKKLFADPMDAVIGLSIVPYAIPTSGAVSVNVGNIPTGISMNKASGQFFSLDCGSVNIEEYFGSYLDYAPYTSVVIYLPYVGYRELKIDEMMGPKPGMSIQLRYHIDILSGSCVAMVKCGSSVMYQFQGHCSTEIPFTGAEWGNAIKSAIDGATAIGMLSAGKGNPASEIGGLAKSVMECKPTIERSGVIGSSGGLMAGQHPYLIITRPRQCKPKNQNHYLGYPAFITEHIGSISGYTSFEEVRLNNIKCNDEEMEEIIRLLKEGVIL